MRLQNRIPTVSPILGIIGLNLVGSFDEASWAEEGRSGRDRRGKACPWGFEPAHPATPDWLEELDGENIETGDDTPKPTQDSTAGR